MTASPDAAHPDSSPLVQFYWLHSSQVNNIMKSSIMVVFIAHVLYLVLVAAAQRDGLIQQLSLPLHLWALQHQLPLILQ
jgi:hypothetical protein